jgi:hypothetical protein
MNDRQAQLQALTESIATRWGGIKRGTVTLFFGDDPCRMNGYDTVAQWLETWKRWYDAGDVEWFEWNTAVYTGTIGEYMERKEPGYHERTARLQEFFVLYASPEEALQAA